jgi:hypothetical protein
MHSNAAFVMAGLVPAIHDFVPVSKTRMPGTRPAMRIAYSRGIAAIFPHRHNALP